MEFLPPNSGAELPKLCTSPMSNSVTIAGLGVGTRQLLGQYVDYL